MPYTIATHRTSIVGTQNYEHGVTDGANSLTQSSTEVPAAKIGQLSTRTDADTGVIAAQAGHGIISTDVIDVFWSGGSRRGMTATVSSNNITVDGGSGDDLPATSTAVTLMKPTSVAFVLDGDEAVGVFASGGGAAGYVAFFDSTPAVITNAAFRVSADSGRVWDLSSDEVNPLADKSVASVKFSHADSSQARTMRAAVAYHSTYTLNLISGFTACILVAACRAAGLLYQDAAKTTPAVADGDLVYVAVCPYSGLNFSAGSNGARPTLRNSGYKWWLEYGGSQLLAATVSLPQPYTSYATGKVSIANGTFFDGHSANTGFLARDASDPATYTAHSSGTGVTSSNSVLAASAVTAGAIFNGTSSLLDLQGTVTSGSTGTTNLTAVTVGCRTGTTAYCADIVTAFSCFSRALTAEERAKVRRIHDATI